MHSGAPVRSKPKNATMKGSAKAGDCDIIFRRPGSATGRNPEPKSRAMAGARSKLGAEMEPKSFKVAAGSKGPSAMPGEDGEDGE